MRVINRYIGCREFKAVSFCPQQPEDDATGIRDRGSCELSNMGVGNPALFLWKSSTCS